MQHLQTRLAMYPPVRTYARGSRLRKLSPLGKIVLGVAEPPLGRMTGLGFVDRLPLLEAFGFAEAGVWPFPFLPPSSGVCPLVGCAIDCGPSIVDITSAN